MPLKVVQNSLLENDTFCLTPQFLRDDDKGMVLLVCGVLTLTFGNE